MAGERTGNGPRQVKSPKERWPRLDVCQDRGYPTLSERMASSSPPSSSKIHPPHQSPRLSPSAASPTAPVLAASPALSHANRQASQHAGRDSTKPVTPTTLTSAEGSVTSKIPPVVLDLRSAPIPIPPRKSNPAAFHAPLTPLTARVRVGHQFPSNFPATPQSGTSLSPGYSRRSRHVNNSPDNAISPSSSAGSTASCASMQRDRPSSPLSPSSGVSLSQMSPIRHSANQSPLRPTSRPTPKLKLKSLPRFHPANYESSSPSTDTTPRPSRPGTAQPHLRQVSDAQKKLQQYQRDVVVNATRAASLAISPRTPGNPAPARLNPLGSPGPVTPLTLESGGDYLLAGSLDSPDAMIDRGRALVQRLVEKENERQRFPRRSESHSPAVSPAGGRW